MVNFEEYRGFFTTSGGSDNVFTRLKPNIKNTFVSFGNFDWIDGSSMRAFFNYIDSLDIYETKFFSQNENPKSPDLINKCVNINQLGASRFYYGFPVLTRKPFMRKQNVIQIVKYNQSNDPSPIDQQGNIVYLGRMRGDSFMRWVAGADTVHHPNSCKRIIIPEDEDIMWLSTFYNFPADRDTFSVDIQWLFNSIFAHEFGHAIGMQHLPLDSLRIMSAPGFRWNTQRHIEKYNLMYSPFNIDNVGIRQPWEPWQIVFE